MCAHSVNVARWKSQEWIRETFDSLLKCKFLKVPQLVSSEAEGRIPTLSHVTLLSAVIQAGHHAAGLV